MPWDIWHECSEVSFLEAWLLSLIHICRNTVINDLKNVIRFLENYNLELTYDIKSGYRIAGDTIKKRAIFFMLFPSLWEYYDRQVVLAENEQYIREILVKLKKIESEMCIRDRSKPAGEDPPQT